MRIGYARVSKADGSQSLDLQRDALRAEGIDGVANLAHLVNTVQDLADRHNFPQEVPVVLKNALTCYSNRLLERLCGDDTLQRVSIHLWSGGSPLTVSPSQNTP